MNNNCGIYKWTNTTNGKVYIGQSIDLDFRKRKFLCFSIQKYGGVYINRARQKYNDKSFWDYEILDYCEPKELDKREIYYINFYHSTDEHYGYNLTNGGYGRLGYVMTDETKKKIGDAQRGTKNHRFGYKLTDEEKKRISVSTSGSNNGMYGKTHTEETREKIRMLKSIPIYQIDLETNAIIKEWESAKDAAKILGFDNSNITACCKGRKDKYKGFKWCYKDNFNAA